VTLIQGEYLVSLKLLGQDHVRRPWLAMPEVRARIAAGAGIIQFGMFLNGHGRTELRNAELNFAA
jgi:hypothetical protein